MSPDDLSKLGTESGHQKALFAWAAMAQRYGYRVAFDMTAYSKAGLETLLAWGQNHGKCVPELEWLHSIPNGGLRDARTAALIKAEGAKKGIADVFLPVMRYGDVVTGGERMIFGGLYIEMKKPTGGVQSEEQKAFQGYCESHGYGYQLCKHWREAATVIQSYIEQASI